MNYIVISSLVSMAALFIFISAFVRIKYLGKVHNYWNKGKSNTNTFANRIKYLSLKLAAVIGVLSIATILSLNLFLALPVELEGMEYGITGDELQTLRWQHKEFSESNFVDFVNDYKKFEHSDVYDFAEARKLEISTYSVFLEHKESMRQLERDQQKAKLELENQVKEEKLGDERKAREVEKAKPRSFEELGRTQNTTTEDPRNVYLYCIRGKNGICFTTPAECDANKFYYGGECFPAACGTVETVLSTRQCSQKGFK